MSLQVFYLVALDRNGNVRGFYIEALTPDAAWEKAEERKDVLLVQAIQRLEPKEEMA